MFCDVDHELSFEELLQDILRCHIDERLFCRRRHALLDYDDSSGNILLLHTLAVPTLGGLNVF